MNTPGSQQENQARRCPLQPPPLSGMSERGTPAAQGGAAAAFAGRWAHPPRPKAPPGRPAAHGGHGSKLQP